MKEINVAAAVIRRRGRVLVCSRPPAKPPAGWEFPGGKLEPGETPAAALRRELIEELGVDAAVLDQLRELWFDYPEKRVHLYFLRCRLPDGVEPTPREGQECRFVEPEDLIGLGLLPADRPVAELLCLAAGKRLF